MTLEFFFVKRNDQTDMKITVNCISRKAKIFSFTSVPVGQVTFLSFGAGITYVIAVLQLRTAFSRLTTTRPCVCAIQYQQVRHKKGAGRFKAPTVGKEKDKWVPRLRK